MSLTGVLFRSKQEYSGATVRALVFELKRSHNQRTGGPRLLEEAEKDWQHITGLTPKELKKSR